MPVNEEEFRSWYKNAAEKWGLHPDPDDSRHHYDYRKAYEAGVRGPTWQQEHKQFRWDDVGKHIDYSERVDHETGKPFGEQATKPIRTRTYKKDDGDEAISK